MATARPSLRDMLPPELARTFGVEKAGGVLPTGLDVLDAELRGGLPRGAVTEIISDDGHGGDWLALRVLANAGDCAVLDSDGSFFPPGAAAAGVDLSSLLVVRERRLKEAHWALERLAREPALNATLAWADGLSDTLLRRLQLAAERSGQALMLLRRHARGASWGALRLRVSGLPVDEGRALLVETLRARGGMMPKPVRIEVNDGALSVRVAAVLPHAAVDARSASA